MKNVGAGVLSLLLLTFATTAFANARLISVVPLDGGCVSGPTGPTVQRWDVEQGKTYEVTISNVTECADGGTAPTLNVRVNSSSSGNIDLVASFVAPGVYVFSYTVPLGATCTMPIFYCTTPGQANTGLLVHRNDGVAFQAHLRSATFQPGCTNPSENLGPECMIVPVKPRTWGQVKSIYR